MAPKPVVTEVENQATPFAEQFMRNLMGGDVGYATALQRNLGSVFGKQITQGPQFFDQSDQFKGLEDLFAQKRGRGAADLTEKFSIAGGRYGTGAGTGLGRFFAESLAAENALLGDLASKSYESGMDRFLALLTGADRFSQGALNPFVAMAQQGIVNPAVHMQESPWVSGINAIANLGEAAGSMAQGFG